MISHYGTDNVHIDSKSPAATVHNAMGSLALVLSVMRDPERVDGDGNLVIAHGEADGVQLALQGAYDALHAVVATIRQNEDAPLVEISGLQLPQKGD